MESLQWCWCILWVLEQHQTNDFSLTDVPEPHQFSDVEEAQPHQFSDVEDVSDVEELFGVGDDAMKKKVRIYNKYAQHKLNTN